MVQGISVHFVNIRTLFVLPCCIIADDGSFLLVSLVKHLSVHMQESPVLQRQMRDRIPPVSDSSFEVTGPPIKLVEPNSKLGISNPRRTKVIEISDLDLVGQQMGNGVSSYCCP